MGKLEKRSGENGFIGPSRDRRRGAAGASVLAAVTLLICRAASAAPLVQFSAAAVGSGVDPAAAVPAWTRFGTAMTNNGSYLLQNNTANDPTTESGEYLSPSVGSGLMKRGAGTYGIEFRVRPLTDVPNLGSSMYANLCVTWSDDVGTFNVTIDKDSDDGASGTTGGLRYGQNNMVNAVTGIDWSTPHTVFVGYRGSVAPAGVFDFYIDGALITTIAAGTMSRSGSFARDAVDFGDGTVGQGLDAAAEWYFVRVYASATPPSPGLFADGDGDGDVDISDFGVLQRCLSPISAGIPAGCGAFDRPSAGFPFGDAEIGPSDVEAFLACLGGANMPPPAGCDAVVPTASQNYVSLYGTIKGSLAETDALIQQCKSHGIGRLVPSLSAGANVGWQTNREPYLPELSAQLAAGFDSLAVMIDRAHQSGLQVLPSVAVAPVQNVVFGHPEWVTKDRNGQPSDVTYAKCLAYSYPQARQSKIALLMDLVNNYAIDGILLDVLRYPENNNPSHPEYAYGFYGYDPPLIQQTQQQYGFDPRVEPVGTPLWNNFNNLRIDSVNTFLQEFRSAVAASAKNIPIVAFGDVNLAGDLGAARDWSQWAQLGLIEEFYSGNYVTPISSMRSAMATTKGLVGPNVVLHGALSPYANQLTTNTQMLQASQELLLGGADRVWIYREDALAASNLWEGARASNEKYIRMKRLIGTTLATFDAGVAGPNIEPNEITPAWIFSGNSTMSNNGTYLAQNFVVNPAQEACEYRSPPFSGLMTRGQGSYAIEFRVRPLTDIATTGGTAYANLLVAWSDDFYTYAATIDRDSDDGGSGTTGGIRVGGDAMRPALSGVDWSAPHTVRIVYDPLDRVFYLTLDGGSATVMTESEMQSGPATAVWRDRVVFGDATIAGADVNAQWYSVTLQTLVYTP